MIGMGNPREKMSLEFLLAKNVHTIINPVYMNQDHNQNMRKTAPKLKMRRIDKQPHQTTTDSSSDGNRHDPGQDQEPDTLEVDGAEGTVAQANADGGAGNAHGS